jgi:malate dehydrogenase (oxaloacetate-decarboxylating)(NADP+)
LFLNSSLLGKDSPNLSHEQAVFAREKDRGLPLIEIVKKYKPTILLGLTAFGGLFNERLITTMVKWCERPIIFALSNPTTVAECTAEQAYEWTDGKCIFASGSPFDPVEYKGQTFHPSQCNNSKFIHFFLTTQYYP